MPEFTSMILRFRDLSTPAGTTTVEEHKKIISEKGHVWWGWWHKQGEVVPEAAFREVLTQIRGAGSYEVMLFDAGKYQLHRARLVDIRWDATLSRIPTPTQEETPAYYSGSHYLAWFKFTDIQPISGEVELQNWAYARVDELFETKKSVFDAFYDKQLASFKELRSQDRTIWFIRPRKSTDGVHEIHVYDRSKIAPSNFPDGVIQLHTPNILWVSDPHFSRDNHDFPIESDMSRRKLSEAIRRDLDAWGIGDIGGLILSGDLTWRASGEEFDLANDFIEDVKSWAKLTASHVIVCPGNHDLAFSDETWKKGTPAKLVTSLSAAEYSRFYERLYEVKPTADLACGRRFWVPDGGLVDVVALNSSSLQQVPGAFQGQGFLGARQLDATASAMRWSRDPARAKAIRICVLHHHVVPIIHTQMPLLDVASSVVHDAGALMRWLVEHEVDMVLHGHMHMPALVRESRALDYPKQENWRDIVIAALGSAGVTASHRAEQPNCYGLLQFKREGTLLTVRRISADEAIPVDQRLVYSSLIKN
jgi:predicted phosphohydrolase